MNAAGEPGTPAAAPLAWPVVLARPAEQWNTSVAELRAPSPVDGLSGVGARRLLRGIDVEAPADVLFRWLCQLRAAPYSYDLIDNLGRRSPRRLTPGLDDLAVGQPFAVFRITSFERDRHITGVATSQARRLFGVEAGSYEVVPLGSRRSRLLVRFDVQAPSSHLRGIRYAALVWGDLVMVRKQLKTFKGLAERSARAQTRLPREGRRGKVSGA